LFFFNYQVQGTPGKWARGGGRGGDQEHGKWDGLHAYNDAKVKQNCCSVFHWRQTKAAATTPVITIQVSLSRCCFFPPVVLFCFPGPSTENVLPHRSFAFSSFFSSFFFFFFFFFFFSSFFSSHIFFLPCSSL